jgi:hypothetical protein
LGKSLFLLPISNLKIRLLQFIFRSIWSKATFPYLCRPI